MGSPIGQILPLALGVALSPFPIAAVILMLVSKRAGANSIAFMIGWITGIVGATVVVIVLANTQDLSTSNGSTGTAGLRIALGVLLLLAGARRWRGRPTDGTAAETPGWLTAADSFTPVKSLGLGFVLATVNPKCLLLIIAAGVTISQANLDNLDTAIVAAIFMLISISTVVGPVVVFHVGGEKGAQMLARTKVWLIANNSAVMAVLLLVFGFVLIGEGIKGLS